MKLFKDYTEDFEKVYKEIDDVKSYVRGKNDDTLIAINNIAEEVSELKKGYDILVSEVVEIKQLLLNQTPNGKVTEVVEIKTDNKPFYKKGGHISTYQHFKNYKTPRVYNLKAGTFSIAGKKAKINLNFEQLVAIIRAYNAGLPVKKIQEIPILKSFTKYAIQNYIYIYRAGGFNQAIMDNGRKFGYNPNKLISREVKENV